MQGSLQESGFPTFSGLTLGKVYKITPEANMVDLLMFDGSILANVQVMVPFASSKSGVLNLPEPKYKKDMLRRVNPLGEAELETESDVIAVVGCLGGSITRPIVLGFLFPEISEVLCGRDDTAGNKDGTMFLWKHPSNVYVRVAKAVDESGTPEIEISHPGGLFIKIGGNEDLTEIHNWDEAVRPFKKSGSPASGFVISHPSGTRISIDSGGNVTIEAKSTTVDGNLRVTSGDSGAFTSKEGKVVSVADGIVIGIE